MCVCVMVWLLAFALRGSGPLLQGLSEFGAQDFKIPEIFKLEHGFKVISAGIPILCPGGHEDTDVPTFLLRL